MMQRYDLCSQHTTAKLMLLYEEDGEQRTVFAFAYGKTVHQSAGGDDVSVEVLIESGTDFLPYWLHCGHTLHGGIVIYCQWQLLTEGKQNGRFHHVLNYNTHAHFHIALTQPRFSSMTSTVTYLR